MKGRGRGEAGLGEQINVIYYNCITFAGHNILMFSEVVIRKVILKSH